MRRSIRAMFASSVLLGVTTAGLIGLTVPAAATGGSYLDCRHLVGPLSGSVRLTDCHGPAAGGQGSMPGATFVGTSTGTIVWTHRGNTYTTTITITTSRSPSGNGRCKVHDHDLLYYVTGTVDSSTDPQVTSGLPVNGAVCFDPGGIVKAPPYGSGGLTV